MRLINRAIIAALHWYIGVKLGRHSKLNADGV